MLAIAQSSWLQAQRWDQRTQLGAVVGKMLQMLMVGKVMPRSPKMMQAVEVAVSKMMTQIVMRTAVCHRVG